MESCEGDGIHKPYHLHIGVRGWIKSAWSRVAMRGKSNNKNRSRLECEEQTQSRYASVTTETQVGSTMKKASLPDLIGIRL